MTNLRYSSCTLSFHESSLTQCSLMWRISQEQRDMPVPQSQGRTEIQRFSDLDITKFNILAIWWALRKGERRKTMRSGEPLYFTWIQTLDKHHSFVYLAFYEHNYFRLQKDKDSSDYFPKVGICRASFSTVVPHGSMLWWTFHQDSSSFDLLSSENCCFKHFKTVF